MSSAICLNLDQSGKGPSLKIPVLRKVGNRANIRSQVFVRHVHKLMFSHCSINNRFTAC